MDKNRNNGRNNICGKKIAELRQKRVPKTSQRALADLLQLEGIDLNKNSIQRIESGKRFVTDIEIGVIAKIFKVTVDELLREDKLN